MIYAHKGKTIGQIERRYTCVDLPEVCGWRLSNGNTNSRNKSTHRLELNFSRDK